MNNDTIETVTETAENTKPKRRRGRGGNRNLRQPALKDWIRVINSQGNGLPNVNIKLIINEATGLCELVTVAPAQEGSTELERQRTQVFKISEYEVINDPSRDPVKKSD